MSMSFLASKRERPQSYKHYSEPPLHLKPKTSEDPITINMAANSDSTFPFHQRITNPLSSGLINLNELAQAQVNPSLLGFGFPNSTLLTPNIVGGTLPSSFLTKPISLPNPMFNLGFTQLAMPSILQSNTDQNSTNMVFNKLSAETQFKPESGKTQKLISFENTLELSSVQKLSDEEKQRPRRWTAFEDQLLKRSVHKHKARNWKLIASEVPGRNHVQCLQRWRKALDPTVVKGHWSPEEDAKLLELVKQNPKNWGHVAKDIEGRTAKQCRERYHNHLDPSIKKGEWSFEEDKLILLRQREIGNKWAEISKQLKGRTENSVKIRWKSIKRQLLALKEESTEVDATMKRKIKRNTMDKERLQKLSIIWDSQKES